MAGDTAPTTGSGEGGTARRAVALHVEGLHCADEVAVLKEAVGPVVGGEDRLAFDLLRQKMSVLVPLDEAGRRSVVAAIEAAGMSAVVMREGRPAREQAAPWRRAHTWASAASGALVAGGLVVHWMDHGSLLHALTDAGPDGGHAFPAASIALFAGAILAGGARVLPRALAALRRMRPDMNLLMTIAVVSAALIGEWFEAAAVAFLFSVALALESWSVGRARRGATSPSKRRTSP